MITLERLQQVKVMITQLDVNQNIPVSKSTNLYKKCYKLIAMDFSKQQKLDADPNAIQQINFTGNQDRAGGSTMFFIIEEAIKQFQIFQKKHLKYYDFISF